MLALLGFAAASSWIVVFLAGVAVRGGCCEYVSIVSVPAFLCVVAIMPHALISA